MNNFVDCECGCRTYYPNKDNEKPKQFKCSNCGKKIRTG